MHEPPFGGIQEVGLGGALPAHLQPHVTKTAAGKAMGPAEVDKFVHKPLGGHPVCVIIA